MVYDFTKPSKVNDLVKNHSQFMSLFIFSWQEKLTTVEVSYMLATIYYYFHIPEMNVMICTLCFTLGKKMSVHVLTIQYVWLFTVLDLF